jgi:large subunit ribosomal protein L22
MSAMEAKAILRFVRISPQKVRIMTEAIKGKRVEAALAVLKFMPQKAAGIVEKVLRSAASNAEENQKLDIDTLVIRNIIVNDGPMLKRFRAKARGRGTRILKRTSHITVILAEKSA